MAVGMAVGGPTAPESSASSAVIVAVLAGVAAVLNSKPFIIEKNMRLWSRMRAADLARLLDALLDLDLSIKRSAIDPAIALESWICDAVRR